MLSELGLSALHIKACLFVEEKHNIRLIRGQVFALEQGISAELDWDGKDDQCVHLVAFLENSAIAVVRLRELSPVEVKLERLAVLKPYRCQGIGSELVYTAIAYSREQSFQQMVLNAQIQTVAFYQRLGFHHIGGPFEDAGIPHIQMQKLIA